LSTATATATPTASATSTPDPYAGQTIADLAARAYGGGQLQVEETLEVAGSFTRTSITYPSDGLTIYGFVNTPSGPGPFPVALVLHGYVSPARYRTLAYTTRYADELARAGYLVIHPNYRNHPPSDEGDDPFRTGYAIDVLNLIALIRQQGGQPGPLQQADPDAIYLLGHSMGGGIALRVVTVNRHVRAAVLYGSMSGDERLNYERVFMWSEGQAGEEELDTPQEDLRRISPIFHLDRVQAAVGIHHGTADDQVPPQWSDDLCRRLQELNKRVECFTYPGQPHLFSGETDQLFIQRVLNFFEQS
jgi:dipeptidyl aminopeptidase/acylaminoacyl peptidase